jgi:hypothetical protein
MSNAEALSLSAASPGASASQEAAAAPVLVCYIPGLDARRVDATTTPYIHDLRQGLPVAGIRTLPSTELVPTLVSGTLPHQHRVWQVSLRPEFRTGAPHAALPRVADAVTSTAQLVHHFFDRGYDLAVIPRRRRRRFDLHRFKYTRRLESEGAMQEFAGIPSIFGLLGEEAHYEFTKDFDALPGLAARLPSAGRILEFVEMYALDLFQHWHLDDEAAMGAALTRTDTFVRELHARCKARGVRFVLLVDHGQERVVGTIPLVQTLRASGIPESEFSYFVELASARLWFHSERARRVLTNMLGELEHAKLVSWQEMHDYDVCFEDDAFGEVYVFADAGRIFFPHDFYQPLGNLVLGLMDHHQRARARDPVHRGNHGYLPHYPSERGWMLVDDAALVPPQDEVRLVDIAPTLLSMVGVSPPDYMQGRRLFTPAGDD